MSSSSGSDQCKYGKWEEGKKCCNQMYYQEVIKITLASCRMTNSSLHKMSKLCTCFTKGQDLSHDFIEAQIECKNPDCQNKEERKFYYTIEYGSDGRHMDVGQYKNKLKEINIYNPRYGLTVKSLKRIYDNSSQYFEAKDYKFLDHNCKVYAKNFYNNIVKLEEELDDAGEYSWFARAAFGV